MKKRLIVRLQRKAEEYDKFLEDIQKRTAKIKRDIRRVKKIVVPRYRETKQFVGTHQRVVNNFLHSSKKGILKTVRITPLRRRRL